jgi:hypothetical protein
MPNVFKKPINGYRFYFFSDDHEPIHVHVESGGGLCKIQIEPEIKLIEKENMKEKQIKKALKIAEEKKAEIVAKWREIIG